MLIYIIRGVPIYIVEEYAHINNQGVPIYNVEEYAHINNQGCAYLHCGGICSYI